MFRNYRRESKKAVDSPDRETFQKICFSYSLYHILIPVLKYPRFAKLTPVFGKIISAL
jgi:hypothetical protein